MAIKSTEKCRTLIADASEFRPRRVEQPRSLTVAKDHKNGVPSADLTSNCSGPTTA